MFKKIQRIHLIGVADRNERDCRSAAEPRLSGQRSDLKLTPVTQRLVERGARIRGGHSPTHLDAADVVVVSSAVKPDNPEIEEARRRQIPTIPRAEMLAELMRESMALRRGDPRKDHHHLPGGRSDRTWRP